MSGKIGAVGFCFGGRYAILMAHEGTKVDAAVANHPAMLGLPTDLDNVKKPLSIALGDEGKFLIIIFFIGLICLDTIFCLTSHTSSVFLLISHFTIFFFQILMYPRHKLIKSSTLWRRNWI